MGSRNTGAAPAEILGLSTEDLQLDLDAAAETGRGPVADVGAPAPVPMGAPATA